MITYLKSFGFRRLREYKYITVLFQDFSWYRNTDQDLNMMNGNQRSHIRVELPEYDQPPPWIPQTERAGHPDYDNSLAQFLLRAVKFRRSRHSEQLGFNIRGGREHRCNIYVSKVLPESSASRVGMKPGDMILSVNGIDFTNLTHDEAVKVLKSVSDVEIRLQYFPHGYQKTFERIDASPTHEGKRR